MLCHHSHVYVQNVLLVSLAIKAFFEHIGDFVRKLNDATAINLFLTELK